MLDEASIKQAALSLLVKHYRFRPRGGPTQLKYDLRGEGGIIVDGFLSFPREDPEAPPFVATLEATSYASREEVRYRVQHYLLGWDATAVAGLLTALAATVLYGGGYRPVEELGWPQAIGAALGLLLVGHLLFRVLFFSLRRYRFIYAVEQFKQYFADEQWVAVAEDVFESSKDPYFEELRDQCIYQGFGLILVDAELRGHIHVTPSRADLFAGRRKLLRFQTWQEFTRKLPLGLPAAPAPKRIGEAPPVRRRRPWMRDPGRYFHQFTVLLLGLTLLGTLFFLEWRSRPVLVVNEAAYERQLLEQRQQQPAAAEPNDWLTDSAAVPPFRPRTQPYLRIDPELVPRVGPLRRPAGLIALDAAGRILELPCSRARRPGQALYALELRLAGPPEPLEGLLRRLQRDGIRAMGLWVGCFDPSASDYALVLAPFYTSQERAERERPRALAALQSRGYAASLRLRILPAR